MTPYFFGIYAFVSILFSIYLFQFLPFTLQTIGCFRIRCVCYPSFSEARLFLELIYNSGKHIFHQVLKYFFGSYHRPDF